MTRADGPWSRLRMRARAAVVIPLRPPFAATAPQPSGRRRPSAACKEPPSPWWTIPLSVAVVVAVFGFTYYPVLRVQYRETRERARLAAELEALEARNERLRANIDRLRTPEGVADYARTQLGLVKRGEHVVVVRDAKTKQPVTADSVPKIDSDRTPDEPTGPWTALLDLVFRVE